MPQSPRSIDILLSELHHPDLITRCNAARELGKTRDPRAVDALLAELHAPDWRVRRNAAQALGAARDRRAVPSLLDALHDRTATVRRRAAVALGRIKDPVAIPALLDAIERDGGKIRDDALHALRKFGTAAIPAVNAALPTVSPGARLFLIELLVTAGDRAACELLLPLIAHENMTMRWQAATLLGKLGDPRAVEPLIAALSRRDVQERSVIARALGELRDRRAVEPLLRLLVDHELHGRFSDQYRAVTDALQTIAGFPRPFSGIVNQSMHSMMTLLGDQQIEQLATMAARLQQGMVDFVAGVSGQPVADAAARIDSAMSGLDVRRRFQQSRSDAQQIVDTLIGWLRADDPVTRAAAAVSLPWYTDPRAIEPLHKAMSDRDQNVRIAAMWGGDSLETTLRYRRQLGM